MLTFQKVANKTDLKEGNLLRVDVEGRPIVLAMVQGKVYAMDAVCSHEGGPLEDGTLDGYELKCPWHYALFDVRNAKVSEQTVWATDLQSYPVKVDEANGDILVNPQPKSSSETTIQQERNVPHEEGKKQLDSDFGLTLIGKEKLEGTDITTFRFTKDGYPQHKAGQFAFFPLDSVKDDSKGPVRHFSLASSPTEDVLIISTRIRKTQYKQQLASLQGGTKVKVSKPQGNFVLHGDNSKPAIFLSGGIGVTPFRSMIKYATDEQLPLKITMFDSNRHPQNILYKDEFDSWALQNKNLKIVYTVTDEQVAAANWSGEHGRIDKSMLHRHVTADEIDNAIFYICGPPGMLRAMQELLQKNLQIHEDRIKFEEFTGY
jgi:ferredoxin-NADP reductase/nitrite reductase/ring-hydroxylating ferredoxin subunit